MWCVVGLISMGGNMLWVCDRLNRYNHLCRVSREKVCSLLWFVGVQIATLHTGCHAAQSPCMATLYMSLLAGQRSLDPPALHGTCGIKHWTKPAL